jgi:tripartite ATP-independent transporter DctM subunit
MTAPMLGLSAIGAMFALLFLRQPVWLALVICGVIGNMLLSGRFAAELVTGTSVFDTASSYNLSVIPLFILMGEIATESRMSAELFRAAKVLLSGMRGGLAVATIGASGAFGAICGSSVATAAAMTRISMPEMRKAGYEDGFAAASVASGGTLGILIPPSIILVIYGSIAEQSVPRLFAASMIPGILLMLLYAITAMIVAGRARSGADAAAPAEGSRWAALREPWQFVLLFVVTIGGIYAGVFSPTEAAAVGAFGAILLGVLRRRLTMSSLVAAVRVSVLTSCVLFAIIIGATIFAQFVVQTRLPELMLGAAQDLALAPWAVLTLIIVIYLMMGCFLEGIGMVLITVPVFLPVVTGFGYDPIWFGVIVVIVVELGLMTPPVGMNLFIIQAQVPDVPIVRLYRGIVPFLVAPLLLIVLLFALPGLALWLPEVLYG